MNEQSTNRGTPAPANTPKKLALAAAVAAVLFGTAWALSPLAGANAATRVENPALVAPTLQQGLVGVADLVERVQPAVVNVSVKGKREVAMQVPQMPDFQFPPGSPFEEFFRQFRGPGGPGGAERDYEAVGSGFIIDADGWVVTNNHVVDGADEITITLQDGTTYDADLRGRDPKTDLALLKVTTSDKLPHVTFGNSDAARVGEQVVAIGNPFGLGGTVTTGIISARGRNINSGPYDDFLQVDAPINRGNSGGPLFNLAGEVIGINTAIFSPSGGSVGIGFAIPSSLAQVVLDDLKADGRVERGWLGVQIQPVTGEIAESLGLPADTRGALVAKVLPDSPAAAAGLQTGDVIVGYGRTAITEVRDLTRAVADTDADSKVEVKVWRHGEQRSVPVAIGRLGDDTQAVASADGDGAQSGAADVHIGVALAPLDEQSRSRFRVAEGTEGALVVDVQRDSPAAHEGLRPGDVIVMVGQSPVRGPADVAKQVKKAAGEDRKSVLLLVDREGSQRFVAVPLAKA